MPTKEFDRASDGSATSCGSDLMWAAVSALTFLAFVAAGKNLGLKHGTWQDGSMQNGSMQLDSVHGPDGLTGSVAVNWRRVGLTVHLSERSKSVSMMWPSSRTSIFSGFRSL